MHALVGDRRHVQNLLSLLQLVYIHLHTSHNASSSSMRALSVYTSNLFAVANDRPSPASEHMTPRHETRGTPPPPLLVTSSEQRSVPAPCRLTLAFSRPNIYSHLFYPGTLLPKTHAKTQKNRQYTHTPQLGINRPARSTERHSRPRPLHTTSASHRQGLRDAPGGALAVAI